ncbi:MAG: asparagine synthase (glutamine-hydrolyzing) [Gammaproteobacteria bacterium]|nr:asparagine synthase (glutamine-hydrolyzing) [Gammaproteobacteria bacterium]
MCGIFGWLGSPEPTLAKSLRDQLRHRGPDADGEWFDPERGVWLGHRRLSVVDLSQAGAQPMISLSGRFVIVFNGEVYNHSRIRPDLEARGIVFRGHSDTEVMLAAIETWGLETALERFIGMFAFALWDRQEKTLKLVRDRIGVKPLYWAHKGDNFAFSSELKPLTKLSWVDKEFNPNALADFFKFLYVPAPMSIVKGIQKLEAGKILTFKNSQCEISTYWNLVNVAEQARANPFLGSLQEACEETQSLIDDAVALRMVADVPVGMLLSGGMDSSIVASSMQEQSSQSIKTFTIRYEDEPTMDESEYAKEVSQLLSTEHRQFNLSAQHTLDLLPKVIESFDEPFADSSSVSSYLVSLETRKHVTVALSGDGGDESFGGYPRYCWAENIENRRNFPLAKIFGKTLSTISKTSPNNKTLKRARTWGTLLSGSAGELYSSVFCQWAISPLNNSNVIPSSTHVRPEIFRGYPMASQFMGQDQLGYLPDDLLVKMDRATMAHSLELRSPLLDHRLIEFAWRLPLNYKISANEDKGKLILRELLYKKLPRHLIDRIKKGFDIPITSWLKGPLKDWASDLLSEAQRDQDPMLNPQALRYLRDECLHAGKHPLLVWSMLMYLNWRKSL